MTENEARGKWCPFARVVGDYGQNVSSGNRYAANRDHPYDEQSRCIASDCMAWRWATEPTEDKDIEHRHVKGQSTFEHVPGSPGDGYCGLAGKP